MQTIDAGSRVVTTTAKAGWRNLIGAVLLAAGMAEREMTEKVEELLAEVHTTS